MKSKRLLLTVGSLMLLFLMSLSSCMQAKCVYAYDVNNVCTQCGAVEYVDPDLVFEYFGGGYAVVDYLGTSETLNIPSVYRGLPVTMIMSIWSGETVKHITIPDTVEHIAFRAFAYQPYLEFNTYENALYLGNSQNPYHVLIKAKDTSITSCKVHRDTKIIYNDAFRDCTALTEIVLGKNVRSIGVGAFQNCDALSYTAYENARYLGTKNNPYLALIGAADEGITSCTTHPKNKVIAAHAFYGCVELQDLVLSEGLTHIGEQAFRSCSGVSSWTLPQSLTNIESGAFMTCAGMKSITIPANVRLIASQSFSRNQNFETIAVDAENKNFHAVGNCLIDTAQKTLIQGFDHSVIPADGSVENIGAWSFNGCEIMTAISIPEGVKRIGEQAFSCCNLKSVALPQSLEWIGDWAFWECDLTEIEIPQNLSHIGSQAFWSNDFAVITLPSTITCIENLAFLDCRSLSEIYFEGNSAEWELLLKDVDLGISQNYTVICTDGKIEK